MDTMNRVLTPDQPHPTDPQRNVVGQFTKGNHASPGRVKRAEESAVLAAINTALPPEKLQQALTDALDMAYEYRSPKLLMAIVESAVSYQVGAPVQRSVSASGKLENILSRLTDMDEDEFSAVERAMRGE
jgi:hypothetical protein